jgi:periplasmic copper chaperone A
MNAILRRSAATFLLSLLALTASAQQAAVQVTQAWARASVQGQRGTGAFMTLTAPANLQLIGAASPVAGVTEVHEMKMEGDVMRMRPVAALDLPAGRAVELKPGGYHVMLMELKAPLKPGTSIPVTLSLRDAAGKVSQQQVQVPVAVSAPAGAHKH